MGIWVDETGHVVRPAEPAWTVNNTLKIGDKSIVSEGEAYVTALRDWVKNGERSQYALSDEEFAKRVRLKSPEEMEAEASFKLAVWFHQQNQPELAAKHWRRAQQLHPGDWNYHRQDWSFGSQQDAGKKWLDKFQKSDGAYYPKLDIKK